MPFASDGPLRFCGGVPVASESPAPLGVLTCYAEAAIFSRTIAPITSVGVFLVDIETESR